MSEQTPAQQAETPLSHRIRPNSEAAPWVIEEVRRMEAELAALRAAVSPQSQEKIRSFWCPHCLSDFEVSGDIRAALEDAKAHELRHPSPNVGINSGG